MKATPKSHVVPWDRTIALWHSKSTGQRNWEQSRWNWPTVIQLVDFNIPTLFLSIIVLLSLLPSIGVVFTWKWMWVFLGGGEEEEKWYNFFQMFWKLFFNIFKNLCNKHHIKYNQSNMVIYDIILTQTKFTNQWPVDGFLFPLLPIL